MRDRLAKDVYRSRRFLALVSGRAAAFRSARAARAVQQRWRASVNTAKQLAVLTDAVRSLAQAAAPDDFLPTVLGAIAEQLRAYWVLLFLHDPAQDALSVHLVFRDGQIIPREHATPNLVHPVPTRAIPLWSELERTRRPVHVRDIQTDPRLLQRDALLAQGVRSMLLVPLVVGDTLIGWFSVRDTSSRTYQADELALATALAQQAALAVQLTRLAAHGRQAAVLEERNRVAREIHDTLAQGFTGIVMQLEATESALENARVDLAQERLAKARELARASLAEARRSIWALHPQALEHQPFAAALHAAARTLTAGTAVQLTVDIGGAGRNLPVELATDLLRVAQEAITNSVKHAGAQTLEVRAHDDGQQLALHVRDDGCGFGRATAGSRDGGGFGLTAMRERMERHGGELTIHTAPGAGTEIIARVDRQQAHTRLTT